MASLPKMAQRTERADNAVFVKSISPVRAAKIRAVHPVDLLLALLRGDAIGGVQRVVSFSVTQNVWRDCRFCRMFML